MPGTPSIVMSMLTADWFSGWTVWIRCLCRQSLGLASVVDYGDEAISSMLRAGSRVDLVGCIIAHSVWGWLFRGR